MLRSKLVIVFRTIIIIETKIEGRVKLQPSKLAPSGFTLAY